MAERYRVILQDALAARLRDVRQRAMGDPGGPDARLLEAARALRGGRERDFVGERLGFSPRHYDLRDCAEIKVPVVQDYTPGGKPMGPSHRMIYREFHPVQDDPRPIRQVLAFEHRANGLPFAVAAAAVDRTKGRGIDALRDLPATKPAIGKNKDPHRPVTPPRQSLPPDLDAALRCRTPSVLPRARMSIEVRSRSRRPAIALASRSPERVPRLAVARSAADLLRTLRAVTADQR